MSIFGASASATPVFGASSSANLFGAPAASSGSSLFGAKPTGASAAFGASSAFGATPRGAAGAFGPTASFGAPTPTFGQTAFGASTPTLGAAGAFGAPTPTGAFGASTPGFGATGAFGASTPAFGASTPAFGAAGAFGASTPAFGAAGAFGASTPGFGGAGAFGASAPGFGTQPTSVFGPSASPPFGAVAQPQPGIPGAQMWGAQQTIAAPIPETTKVHELPPHLQNELLACETHFRQQRMKAAKLLAVREKMDTRCYELSAQSEQHEGRLRRAGARLQVLHKQVEALCSAISVERRSYDSVSSARDSLARVGDGLAVMTVPSWQRYDMRTNKIASVDRSAHVPDEYFARVVADMERRANEYRREIDEIDDFLRAQGVRLGTTAVTGFGFGASTGFARARTPAAAAWPQLGSDGAHEHPRGLDEVLQRQYQYFMRVASQIAHVHENLRILSARYIDLLGIVQPDASNPFKLADMREKAEKERERILAEKRAEEAARAAAGQQPGQGGAAFGSFATPGMQTQGSLFGVPSQPGLASGSGFGSTFGSTAAFGLSGSSLFGAPSTTPASGSSLFGAPSATPTSSSSLFGAPSATPTSGSSLFGAPSTTPGGTSLFGAPSTTPTSSSLFGGAASTTGSFGSSTPSVRNVRKKR